MATATYDMVDVTLEKWTALVKERYPTAKIRVAPEEFGGTREAFVNSEFVGDWDGGGDGFPGRIKVIKH